MSDPCPLITAYTQDLGMPESLLDKLWRVRRHDPSEGPIPIKVGPLFRDTVSLRNFQTQSVAHLMLVPRMIIADAVGLGKSVQAIAGMCYHAHKDPDLKILVITTKSVVRQFHNEILRFSNMTSTVMEDRFKKQDGHEARMAQVETWLAEDGPRVMCTRYSSLIGRRQAIDGDFDDNGDPVAADGKEVLSKEIRDLVALLWPHRANLLVIFDECHKLKNPTAQTRTAMMQVQRCATRCWGLSASLVSNGADEIYGVMSAMGIRPFASLDAFRSRFCVYHMLRMGRRVVPKLTGYRKMDEFKREIRPFIYGRSQRQVKEPLPRLTTKYHEVELDAKQERLLLRDIPSGHYQLSPAVKKIAGQVTLVDRDPTNRMTMMSVYQLVANHSCLLEAHDPAKLFTKSLSPKEEAMFDLLEGDLKDQKVIIFTKYRTYIDRLEHLFQARGEKVLRITGAENEVQRDKAKELFQDPDSGYNIICINSAGLEGINLQEAGHMIGMDLPWSFGSTIQLVGRMLRIASPHSACTFHIMVAKGTPDEYVISTLLSKKGVFEAILGESHSAGLLEEEAREIDLESSLDRDMTDEEFSKMLRAHAKDVSMGEYLKGDKLRELADDIEYETSYKHAAAKQTKKKKVKDLSQLSF
jgi:SNF2 family DNA or RNA helicase